MTPDVDARRIRETLSQAKDLPAAPAVALQVSRMSQGQQTSADDLAAALSQDPVLAAKLLKLSNCALFGRRNEITSLARACTMLGFRAVRVWSLGFAVLNTLARKKPQGFDYEGYRTRSLIRAVVATLLVQDRHPQIADEAFTAALVSDIGEYVVAVCRPADYQALTLLRASEPLTGDAERAVLGYTTYDLGAEFLRKWGLPELICDAVQLIPHSDAEEDASPWRSAPAGSVDLLTDVLVLAQDFERLTLGRFTSEALAGIRLRGARLFGRDARAVRENVLDRMVECYLSLIDGSDNAVLRVCPPSAFRHATCQDLQARLCRFEKALYAYSDDSDPDAPYLRTPGVGPIWSPDDIDAEKGVASRATIQKLSEAASAAAESTHVSIGYVAFGDAEARGAANPDLALVVDAVLCEAQEDSIVIAHSDRSFAILLPNPEHTTLRNAEAVVRRSCERVAQAGRPGVRVMGTALWLSSDPDGFHDAFDASLTSWNRCDTASELSSFASRNPLRGYLLRSRAAHT